MKFEKITAEDLDLLITAVSCMEFEGYECDSAIARAYAAINAIADKLHIKIDK